MSLDFVKSVPYYQQRRSHYGLYNVIVPYEFSYSHQFPVEVGIYEKIQTQNFTPREEKCFSRLWQGFNVWMAQMNTVSHLLDHEL